MKVGITKIVDVEAQSVLVNAKVRDAGCYTIIDQHGSEIGTHDGYVPSWFPGEHYGDYLILEIDLESGHILNWKTPRPEWIQEMIEPE